MERPGALLENVDAWRDAARRLVDHPWFERVIITLIVINAAILGLETDQRFVDAAGPVLKSVDSAILAVFVVEILLRLGAHGRRYLASGWSWFDIAVVAIAFAPTVGGVAALRAFRILRLFRLFSVVPKMRRVISGFFSALPGMAGVVGVLALIFYVSAVIATTMFGRVTLETAPPGATAEDVEAVVMLFGTLERSFFTLFQLMTLENWVDGIVSPTMKLFPNAMLFFLPYIVVTAFAVLNLFIGIIVDAMQDERDEAVAAERHEEHDALFMRLDAMAAEISRLREDLGKSRDVDP